MKQYKIWGPKKLKVMNVDYDIMNLLSIGNGINTYPREDNNCGDYSIMVIIYDGHLCETIIDYNTDLRSNNIL